MAFISKERVKEVREELKKTFPAFKFSVRVDGYTAIRVTLLSGPVKFIESDYSGINHFYPEKYDHADVLKGMIEIINKGNYTRHDHGMDYADVGFYVTINQGAWDRPYVVR